MNEYDIAIYVHFKNPQTKVAATVVVSTLDELQKEETWHKEHGYVCTKKEVRCTKRVSLFEEQIIYSKQI